VVDMGFLEANEKAPAFSLKDKDNTTHKLSDYKGQWVVLYFYPKDDTPGCTVEGKEFSELKKEFEKHKAVVLGVSADSPEKHEKFIKKHNLKITLLCDPEYKTMEKYGAYGNKILYGKTFLGIKRSTYIIDPKGKVAKVWKAVRSKGHAQKVLENLQELQ